MNTTNAENDSSSHPSNYDHHEDIDLIKISMSVNFILSLPLNGYVMWLILTGVRGTLASDIFSLNLAISDIFFTLCSMSYLIYMKLKIFLYLETFAFSLGFLLTARPLFQCCICVECYVGVVHPVLFLKYKPLRYRVACCCVVYLISLVSCIYSKYTFSKTLYLYWFFVQNLLFFSVMISCCFSVLWALKRPGPGEQEAQRTRRNAKKRRAFQIMSLIMISMAISFFLYVAAIPMQCCLTFVDFTRAITICISLALAAGFIQPLLYLHRNGKLNCFKKP